MNDSTPCLNCLAHVSTPEMKAVDTRIRHVLTTRERRDRLSRYAPYPKQKAFHAAGRHHRERLFLAGNQVGKTLAGSFEMAIHLTGRYPDWWRGRRWTRPIVAWAAGITGESTRDNPQRLLLGRPGEWGTGAIPHEALGQVSRAPAIRDLADTVRVRHVSGGYSILAFKAYEKGRDKWQGETLDLVWFDEEPPSDIYLEGLTRTNATGGAVYLTCTPLLGMTQVVGRFMQERAPDRHMTQMTIDEAAHFSPEMRARIIASYPAFERDARTKGVPMLGAGRVFPVHEEAITVDPFAIPPHWSQIGGMDFGWDHPFAAVRLAWDRDADCLYVTDVYKATQTTPVVHAERLKSWGAWLPWAWPHDGLQHEKGSGAPLAELYRSAGLNLLPMHAQFATTPDGKGGGTSVEAGLMEMLQRMQSGRLKVFRGLEDWFREFRVYHRKDGLVVKVNDDLLCATRYALMMREYGKPAATAQGFGRRLHYPPSGVA